MIKRICSGLATRFIGRKLQSEGKNAIPLKDSRIILKFPNMISTRIFRPTIKNYLIYSV
jgi:hypothetical protein